MLTGYSEEDSPYSTKGQKGTFYFEFSRALRTMDRLQQVVYHPDVFSLFEAYVIDNVVIH